jgi:hypothetical protein
MHGGVGGGRRKASSYPMHLLTNPFRLTFSPALFTPLEPVSQPSCLCANPTLTTGVALWLGRKMAGAQNDWAGSRPSLDMFGDELLWAGGGRMISRTA